MSIIMYYFYLDCSLLFFQLIIQYCLILALNLLALACLTTSIGEYLHIQLHFKKLHYCYLRKSQIFFEQVAKAAPTYEQAGSISLVDDHLYCAIMLVFLKCLFCLKLPLVYFVPISLICSKILFFYVIKVIIVFVIQFYRQRKVQI